MTYTIPPLNAVNSSLSVYTAPDLTRHESGLSVYSAPSLSSVNFALTAYTVPSAAELGGRVDYEIGDGGASAQNLTATSLVNTNAFGSDKVSFIIYENSLVNAPVFGTAKIDFIIYPSGFINGTLFGNASAQLDTVIEPPVEQPVEGGGHAISERVREYLKRQTVKPKSVVNKTIFGNAKVANGTTHVSFINANEFGSHSLQYIAKSQSISSNNAFGKSNIYENFDREDEEILLLVA